MCGGMVVWRYVSVEVLMCVRVDVWTLGCVLASLLGGAVYLIFHALNLLQCRFLV